MLRKLVSEFLKLEEGQLAEVIRESGKEGGEVSENQDKLIQLWLIDPRITANQEDLGEG